MRAYALGWTMMACLIFVVAHALSFAFDLIDPVDAQPEQAELEPEPAPPEKQVCYEDEPCWDCETMGNQVCGPVVQADHVGCELHLADVPDRFLDPNPGWSMDCTYPDEVVPWPGDEYVSVFGIWYGDGTIVLPRDLPPEFREFIALHEIGHHYNHRVWPSTLGSLDVEVWANCFASVVMNQAWFATDCNPSDMGLSDFQAEVLVP